MSKHFTKIILFSSLLIPLGNAFADEYYPTSDRPFTSGAYLGVQAGYIYVIDDVKYISSKENNHDAAGAGAYLGYGHVFEQSYLQYLGVEAGFNYRTKYSDKAYLNGSNINGQWNKTCI